jgi:UDP-N-acetylglucosamine 2-epimerase (non-hydrolysing)
MSAPKVLVVFGTRPEAIKMFPVVQALQAQAGSTPAPASPRSIARCSIRCWTIARITPDIDLDVMQANQSLDELLARL